MSAHTPGPWKFYEENKYGGTVELGSTNVTVSVDRADMFTCELAISREEMRSNGRLIAAAPDLRDAVEAAIDEFAIGTFNAARRARVVEFLRAAIAKAEGGS